jgi:hypothetical protein
MNKVNHSHEGMRWLFSGIDAVNERQHSVNWGSPPASSRNTGLSGPVLMQQRFVASICRKSGAEGKCETRGGTLAA